MEFGLSSMGMCLVAMALAMPVVRTDANLNDCINIQTSLTWTRNILRTLSDRRTNVGLETPDIDFNNEVDVQQKLSMYISELETQTKALELYSSATPKYSREILARRLRNQASDFQQQANYLIDTVSLLTSYEYHTTDATPEVQPLRNIFSESYPIVKNLQVFLLSWRENSNSLHCSSM